VKTCDGCVLNEQAANNGHDKLAQAHTVANLENVLQTICSL
jgi:hypothetical protein